MQNAKVVVEVSVKPLISFVWLGCLLITVGALWSSVRSNTAKRLANN